MQRVVLFKGFSGRTGLTGRTGAHETHPDLVETQKVYGYNPTYEGHTVREDAADDKAQVEDP